MQESELKIENETKLELLRKLNEMKKKLYGNKSHSITMKQLNYHAYPKNNPNRYVQFQIPKKKKHTYDYN